MSAQPPRCAEQLAQPLICTPAVPCHRYTMCLTRCSVRTQLFVVAALRMKSEVYTLRLAGRAGYQLGAEAAQIATFVTQFDIHEFLRYASVFVLSSLSPLFSLLSVCALAYISHHAERAMSPRPSSAASGAITRRRGQDPRCALRPTASRKQWVVCPASVCARCR